VSFFCNHSFPDPTCPKCIFKIVGLNEPGPLKKQLQPAQDRTSPRRGSIAAPDPELIIPPIVPSHSRERGLKRSSSLYPAYQSLPLLLSDFRARLGGFLEAQSFYILLRPGAGRHYLPSLINNHLGNNVPDTAIFQFDGEYSLVAPDFRIAERQEAVGRAVDTVKSSVEEVGGLKFGPTRWVSVLPTDSHSGGSQPRSGRKEGGGVITRFACVHDIQVFLPVSTQQTTTAYRKSMQGELEVAVLPDCSHRYFPGERHVIRFCLVG